jgi:hypothetical protein
VTGAALAVFAALVMVADDGVRGQDKALSVVPIFGHWQQGVEGSESIVTVDATKWDKKPVADPLGLAKRLFKTPEPQFEANATSQGAFPVAAIEGVERFTSGKATVQFKLIAGPSDQIAGLVCDLKPNGEYLVVRYNTRDGNVAIWKYSNGKRARIADGTDKMQLPIGTWHTLELTVAGRTLTGNVNKQLTVTHALDQQVDGRLGFWAKPDSVTAFKGLRVE